MAYYGMLNATVIFRCIALSNRAVAKRSVSQKNPLILQREKLDIGNQATANPQCQVISHTDITTILRPSSYAPLHPRLFALS
jgi:hypothetical protein